VYLTGAPPPPTIASHLPFWYLHHRSLGEFIHWIHQLPHCSICFTYYYVFSSMRNASALDDTQRMLLETDHNFVLCFFVIVTFTLSWLPTLIIRSIPMDILASPDREPVHFVFMWLAIGGGSCKLLIYLIISQEFRRGLLNVMCCLSHYGDIDNDNDQLDNDNNGAIYCYCCCRCCPSYANHRRRLDYRNLSTERQRYL
jgi:hypothetical protein